MKDGAPRGGMHKADEVAPREAMLDRGQRALAVNTPGLVQDGLEATAMLVDRPELNLRVRKRSRYLLLQGAQVGPKLGLGHRVSPHVARPGFQPTSAEPSQGAPIQLAADLTSQTLAEPGGHGPSAPAVAVGMRAGHGRSQVCQVGGRQGGAPYAHRVATVSHAGWAVRVVAPGDLPDPVGGIACDSDHGRRRHAARHQPEEVPMATLDWICCAAIAVMEFVVSQVRFEVDASWQSGRPLARYTLGPFPSGPRRTQHAGFLALGSPVTISPWRTRRSVTALCIPHTSRTCVSGHLCPFALWPTFPASLVGRDAHDYSGHSVALGVAPRRPSQVPCYPHVTARRRESVRTLCGLIGRVPSAGRDLRQIDRR